MEDHLQLNTYFYNFFKVKETLQVLVLKTADKVRLDQNTGLKKAWYCYINN
jgi:hypothetical protein